MILELCFLHSQSWFKVDDRIHIVIKTWIFHKHFCLFSELLPYSSMHGFKTRQASAVKFTLSLPKTNTLKNTVMYGATCYWRMLPADTT